MRRMVQTEKKTKKTKTGAFQWLIFIIVPLIFALIITFIILSLMGIDVVNKSKEVASQIPFVENLVTTEEDAEQERKEEQFQKQIESKDKEIADLIASSSGYQLEIDQLNQEIVKLTKQLEVIDEELNDVEQVNENLEKLTKSYQEMNPGNAANILASIDEDVAVSILQDIKDEQRGSILSAMDPEVAALLTELLLD